MTSTIEVVPIFFVAQRSHINRYFITFAHKNDSGSFDNILTKAFLLYPSIEIRQKFKYRIEQSQNAYACLQPPRQGERHMAMRGVGCLLYLGRLAMPQWR